MSKPYAIVAGDFTPWGGMDRPNYELAWYLAEEQGAEVHLVSHRVASPLSDHPNVVWHRVPRPLGRHTLGEPFLDRWGRKIAREFHVSAGPSWSTEGIASGMMSTGFIMFTTRHWPSPAGPRCPNVVDAVKAAARSPAGTAGRRRVTPAHHGFRSDEGSSYRWYFGRPGACTDDLLRDRPRKVPTRQCRRTQ